MNRVTVFYNNQVLIEFETFSDFSAWRKTVVVGCPEFYNGAWVHFSDYVNRREWYRMDLTPVLLSDVPKELLTLLLLMK